MVNCSCSVGPIFGGCDNFIGDEDIDLHESLRMYARAHLGAPAEMVSSSASTWRDIHSLDGFKATFRFVLERNGWPVLKCGNGKGLRRCLMVDGNDQFTWGSKKSSNRHPTYIPLTEIKSVSRIAFRDGPTGANPKAMLIFNINHKNGLKILCESESDAVVLAHGFTLISSV